MWYLVKGRRAVAKKLLCGIDVIVHNVRDSYIPENVENQRFARNLPDKARRTLGGRAVLFLSHIPRIAASTKTESRARQHALHEKRTMAVVAVRCCGSSSAFSDWVEP